MPATAEDLHVSDPCRRRLAVAAAAWPLSAAIPRAGLAQPAGADAAEAALRDGGVVVAFRHASAPGTFDPPGFRLDDCRTQRNLDDVGRAQARRIGAWFADRGLRPARVRSSPWCRCVETASLAFRAPDVFAALGSPHGVAEATSAESLATLRAAAADVSGARGFEAWFTHMFVLSALAGEHTASGEGLVLRYQPGRGLRVVARLAPA